ncbi:unnamed protein product [Symbiodinium sp. CCMP2592]|nr:unnamed protein product [Symbiodinium sp. CCMP2592]
MKQPAWLLLSLAATWVPWTPVTAVKFTQDDLSLENVNESLSTALILRSSRGTEEGNFTRDQDLDAVVSGKIFHDIGDGFAKVGNTLKAVGMKAGEAAGNAAIVVGNHVMEAAKAKLDLLPWDVKQLANQLGGIAKGMANGLKEFGKTLEKGVVDLADDALKHAQHFAEQGVMLATRVGDKIATEVASKARWLGDKVKTLGPLVAGLASAAWEQIKKFVNCLDNNGLMCPILIGSHCDCPSGSSVRFENGGLNLRCVIGKSAGFGMGYGFKAQSGGKFGGKKAGKLQLPGQIFEEKKAEAKQAFKKKKGGLKNKMSGAPTGSCETSIDMAIEGHVQNALIIGMHTNGPFTTIDISGGVGVSLDGMIKAQGSCTLTAEKRFPKVPKKKVICYKAFCIVIMLQMVAQLEITGALTGTLELGAEVGFDIEGKITVDKTTGKATAEFKAPSVDRQAAFAMGASAFASIRLGAGPFIVVYPVPGVPVNFNPMLNLEVRAQGDIKFGPVGVALIQEPGLEPTNISSVSMLEGSEAAEDAVSSHISSGSAKMLKMCAAAALNIYIDSGITAFGIPVEFDIDFRPQDIAAEILQSYLAGALAAVKVLEAGMSCVPGLNKVSGVVTSTMENVAREAAKKVTSMIPDLNIDFSGKPVALAVDKVYCVEAYTTPGFSTASCAEELGCKHVGRKPSSDAEVTRILPQKQKPSHELLHTRQLVHELGLGDHFIELGNFRLAAMDQNHFSISHCTGNKAHTYYWPTLNSGRRRGVTREINWPACQKRCSDVWNCVHFTFYPSGSCRLHTSAAKQYTSGFNGIAGPQRTENHNCRTIQIWHADGTNYYGPRADWGAWHKPRTPNAHVSAIKFGFEFIQIGHFRLGAADDEHLSLSHMNGNTLEIFKDDGYIDGNRRTDYGTWDRPVGKPLGISFGDRFLQLGNFRIGDEDNMRFVISSVKKKTSIQVFDGHDGKTKGNQWHHYTTFLNRPPADYTVRGIGETSFGPCDPQFAAWGDRFIQLGDWRMGAYDDHHFTFSHKDGRTAEILTSDGGQHRHHPSSSFGTWHRPLGFPSGIVFGHQFIQFGNWRVAAIDGQHLSISHRRGKTAKLFKLNHHPHLHWGFTGGLTTYSAWGRNIGPASGVNFGDKFIQIGDFRIGDSDGTNLAVTFAPWGNSIYRFHKDGWADTDHHGSYGPAVNNRPTHWHCGNLQEAMGSCTGIVTGEDFMQIGDWRLAAEGDTFSVSHIDGQAKTFSAASLLQTNESLTESAASASASLLQSNESLMVDCFEANSYYSPVDIPGHGRSHAHSWQECQTRCAQVAGCAHFSRWPDGGCHIQHGAATKVAAHGVTAGPPLCPEGCAVPHTQYTPVDMPGQGRTRASDWKACQSRCASVNGCAHFNYWPDHGCHISASSAARIASHGVLSGAPVCKAAPHGVWSRQPLAPDGNLRVQFGDRVVQIGKFRLGDVDGKHFSISHSNGKTLVIYRSNSAHDAIPVHPQTRWDWGMWGKTWPSRNPDMSPMGVSFGDRFVQIGNFRLGDVDGKHFSVAHAGSGKTLMVFQSDGNHGHHHCPRDDFTTLGRSMEQCQEMEP